MESQDKRDLQGWPRKMAGLGYDGLSGSWRRYGRCGNTSRQSEFTHGYDR